jgi:branched-chain amino acid transport system substrate-binding protein
MKSKLILIIIPLICVSLFSLLVNTALSQPKGIKIGWTGPLTGPIAEGGTAMKQGSVLALEEWNVKGGVYFAKYRSKIPAEILFEDCQSKPEVGVSVGEKLIMRDKVHMLLGDAYHSSVTIAIMELAPKYNIPIMSIAAGSDEITKKIAKDPKRYWSFWKMNYGAAAAANATFGACKFLIDQKAIIPKKKTFAFMAEDSDYGRSQVVRTKELLEGIGWKSVAIEYVPIGHTDFYSQLTKIKNLEADILFSTFNSLLSGVATVKQFHEIGLKSFHFGDFYANMPEFILQAGKASEHLVWEPLQLDPINILIHKEFSEKVRKRWNVSANIEMAYGYDGVYNALDSMERAGSLESKDIVDALSKLDRKGVTGRFVFDQSKHEGKDGPDFIPLIAAQIIGGKNLPIWPPTVATGKYVPQPWTK